MTTHVARKCVARHMLQENVAPKVAVKNGQLFFGRRK